MPTERMLNFLVPSLHPNTLVDLSFPDTKLGPSSATSEPIVRHLPIKYGEYKAVGGVKRMISTADSEVIVADDKFQLSTLSLSPLATDGDSESDTPSPPMIIAQSTIKARSKDVWAGLIPVQGGTISALTSGLMTYQPSTSQTASTSRTVPAPLTTLASSPLAPGSFALAGKEVEVSIWDVERTFSSEVKVHDQDGAIASGGKRKKDALLPGQIWQAKNVPPNYLSVRQPIHHLALTYLSSPNLLVSGTKMGTVRSYDTRQRKPVSDWKVAREGGVGCLVHGLEHELFFADHSNLLGAIDLRTGKILYTYSTLTSTPHHLVSIPPPPASSSSSSSESTSTAGSLRIGLGSIALDATFRLHSTSVPPALEQKGNWGGEGKKGAILGMAGGVGIGQGIFRGWSERQVVSAKSKSKRDGDEDDEQDASESGSEDENVWEGMDEIQDAGRDSDESDDEDEDEEVQDEKRKTASKRTKRA